jgi:hypothetical protein
MFGRLCRKLRNVRSLVLMVIDGKTAIHYGSSLETNVNGESRIGISVVVIFPYVR